MTKNGNSSNPDYFNVDVPKDKDPEEFTYIERRAELLEDTLEIGDPAAISRTKRADRYGVSIPQITKDMKRIAACMREHISKQQYTARLQACFNKVFKEKMEEGQYMAAWSVIRDWGHYLFEVGEIEKEPDKVDLQGGFEINVEGVEMRDAEEIEEGPFEIEEK